MSKRNSSPIYIQVAIDVASRIMRNEIKADSKISGRSTLAGEYNVSPETIRKAMRLLADMNIVNVKHGNGIYVTSAKKAEEFIERYQIKANINELKEELIQLMKKRQEIDDKMNLAMNSIIDYTSRFKNSEHIVVHEYYLDFEAHIQSRALSELNFWANTGITMVGIRRNGETILSPAPTDELHIKDRLLYVGDSDSSLRLGEYLRVIFEAN